MNRQRIGTDNRCVAALPCIVVIRVAALAADLISPARFQAAETKLNNSQFPTSYSHPNCSCTDSDIVLACSMRVLDLDKVHVKDKTLVDELLSTILDRIYTCDYVVQTLILAKKVLHRIVCLWNASSSQHVVGGWGCQPTRELFCFVPACIRVNWVSCQNGAQK